MINGINDEEVHNPLTVLRGLKWNRQLTEKLTQVYIAEYLQSFVENNPKTQDEIDKQCECLNELIENEVDGVGQFLGGFHSIGELVGELCRSVREKTRNSIVPKKLFIPSGLYTKEVETPVSIDGKNPEVSILGVKLIQTTILLSGYQCIALCTPRFNFADPSDLLFFAELIS